MDRTVASRWAVDLLTGSLTDGGSNRDPPTVRDPVLRMRTRAFRIAFPDLTVSLLHVAIDGAWVAVQAIGHASHTATFQGCRPTGRVWTASCTALFLMAPDSIIKGWVSWDLLSILEQLGAVERASDVSA